MDKTERDLTALARARAIEKDPDRMKQVKLFAKAKLNERKKKCKPLIEAPLPSKQGSRDQAETHEKSLPDRNLIPPEKSTTVGVLTPEPKPQTKTVPGTDLTPVTEQGPDTFPPEVKPYDDLPHGWVKLHRKSEDSQAFQNEGLWKVWTWCFMKAKHKDEWVSIKIGRGTTEVLVKRGQFIFGRKSAAKALKMDESTVYKRMQKLENIGNLNTESNTHYSIVTILNYEFYQGSENDEVTPKVTPKEHPSNTYKKLRNKDIPGRVKKEKPAPDHRVKEFFDFWKKLYLQERGIPYVFAWKREGDNIRGMLKVHSLETIQKAAVKLFKDEKTKRNEAYNIGWLRLEINRLVGSTSISPFEQAQKEKQERDEKRAAKEAPKIEKSDINLS